MSSYLFRSVRGPNRRLSRSPIRSKAGTLFKCGKCGIALFAFNRTHPALFTDCRNISHFRLNFAYFRIFCIFLQVSAWILHKTWQCFQPMFLTPFTLSNFRSLGPISFTLSNFRSLRPISFTSSNFLSLCPIWGLVTPELPFDSFPTLLTTYSVFNYC